MVSTTLLAAIAGVGLTAVKAQTNSLCSSATITVDSAAAATIPCQTVKNIVFEEGSAVANQVIISGPRTIEGDLIIRNATNMVSLSSTSITKIGGKFELNELQLISNIQFTSLQEVEEIEWIALPALETLNFGSTGVTTVSTVRISNTFLSSLDGLNLDSVKTFQIDNNSRLNKWSSQLVTINDTIRIADNSADLVVDFPKLQKANNLDIRGLKSITVPGLEEIEGSINLQQNNLLTGFIAPNLTLTGKDVSFRNNDQLSNITFPLLEKTGGSIVIQNNQKLLEIDGFPKLKSIGGAVTVRGNFTEAALPALDDVKGAFDVTSTEDISASCDEFKKISPKKNGGSGVVQGTYKCTSSDQNANTGGKNGTSSSQDEEDASSVLGLNLPIVLCTVLVASLSQLL